MVDTNIKIGRQFLFVIICCMVFLGCNEKESGQQTLSTTAFQTRLNEAEEDAQLIDVRTPEEFEQGHLEGAVNINSNDAHFNEQLAKLNKDKPVFVYCLSGGRSGAAAETLQTLGFKEIYNLKGGIMAWKNAALPVTESEGPAEPDQFTEADFKEVIQNHPSVLIDFYADWCVPCKQMEPVLNKLSKEYQGKVLIYRVNVDKAKALSSTLRIEGIPLFHLYKNGKLIKTTTGLQSEEAFRELLNSI